MAKIKEVTSDEVPEVAEFEEVKERIQDLRRRHPDVFEELDALVEQYNTTLEAADKVVRAREVSCGPFELLRYTTKYSAEALYDAVGRDEFMALGGTIKTVQEYELDVDLLKAKIAQNRVPSNVVEAISKETPSFRKLDKIKLP